jgi:TATA-box binding protein (TBP) (component of TFIID and TFIIIB)
MDKIEKTSNMSNVSKKRTALNIDFDKLPDDISISTMTITCKIDTEFNVTNIGRYIDLKYDGIIAVRTGRREDEESNRSLIIKKVGSHRNKKKKAFYNQATILVRTKEKKKPTNVKLFSNGSIQMTGCKGIDDVIDALTKVFSELKIVKGILDYNTGKIIEKPFVVNADKLHINNLYDIKICMINSNFTIGFNVDRDKLFESLVRDNIECSYDPIMHACVSIKFEHVEKIISIFVFESGSVIITGARSCIQIVEAYNFINKYLLNNYHYISKNNALTSSTILEFLETSRDSKIGVQCC